MCKRSRKKHIIDILCSKQNAYLANLEDVVERENGKTILKAQTITKFDLKSKKFLKTSNVKIAIDQDCGCRWIAKKILKSDSKVKATDLPVMVMTNRTINGQGKLFLSPQDYLVETSSGSLEVTLEWIADNKCRG